MEIRETMREQERRSVTITARTRTRCVPVLQLTAVKSHICINKFFFFFSSRRRHTRWNCDWSSDVCSSDLIISTTQIYSDSGELEGAVATIKDITEEVAPQRREVVAESKLMRDVINFTKRVAASEAATILLEGENGTGKGLIAKTLHYGGMRRAEPFIAINCAAIPDTLLESELFGYEQGAFTDRRPQKRAPC